MCGVSRGTAALSLFPPQGSRFRPELPDTIPTGEEAVTMATVTTAASMSTKCHYRPWRRHRDVKDTTEEEDVIVLALFLFYYS